MGILVSVRFFDPSKFSYLFLFTITTCSRTFTVVNIPDMITYNCLISLFMMLGIFLKTKRKIFFYAGLVFCCGICRSCLVWSICLCLINIQHGSCIPIFIIQQIVKCSCKKQGREATRRCNYIKLVEHRRSEIRDWTKTHWNQWETPVELEQASGSV